MKLWKQLVICLIVLVVGVGLWARFFPGAGQVLAKWGIDWLPIATASTPPAGQGGQQAGGQQAGAQGQGQPQGQGQRRQGPPQSPVYAQPAASATINDRLSAIGTGRANNSVVVTPFSSGRIVELPVESGQTVTAGTVLAKLDRDAEEIAVDRARIALDNERANLQRVTALRASNTATAVQATEAELAARNAELALRDAQLTLQRRNIVAPIAGVVGILPVSVGNYVTASTSLATIDDRSQILLDFVVPETVASKIEIGAPIETTAVSRPGETFAGKISAIDNRIDATSRTLKVQARVTNPDDRLRAGMSFKVTMRFPGDTFPSVDPLAIQWGTDGAYIWTVVDGKAARLPVKVIQRNTDSVLVDAKLAPGVLVVTEGVQSVRQGAQLQIANLQSPPNVAQAAPATPATQAGN